MATNKTWLLALVVLAVSLMQLASPAMGAPRHLLQDPLPPAAEGLPAASPAPMPMDSLPGAGGLMGNTTANETAIQECAMLLESYNITLVNATTNETLVSCTNRVGLCVPEGARGA
jgi:hypothetical protein